MVEPPDLQIVWTTPAAITAAVFFLTTAFATMLVRAAREGRADGALQETASRVDTTHGAEER